MSLKVKPLINEGDAIQLDIEQETSAVKSSSNAADITTTKRSIKTSVIVDDGQLIVLGGLVDDSLNEAQQKIPLLGDIPLLGNLFKYRTTNLMKRNLYVFLRPTIVRDAATSNNVSMQKYNFMRAQQIDQRDKGFGLLKDEHRPVLPEINNVIDLRPEVNATSEEPQM